MFALRLYRQKVESLEEKAKSGSLEVLSIRAIANLYEESNRLSNELCAKDKALSNRAAACAKKFFDVNQRRADLRRQAKE